MPRNVLVLGAGMISPPLVRYLLARTEHRLVIAAKDTSRVRREVEGHARGRVLRLDVDDTAGLRSLAAEADLLVSLLPATLNPRLARLAIERHVPFVTTSYASPELRALDAEARAAGSTLLCEVGLDPGIDHMSAMRAIADARRRGGRVTSLSSCCGGLPAPDANDNPWGYKFSWFPRAVLLAARQPARYLRDRTVIEVAPPELYDRCWPYPLDGHGSFEVYPNRDALAYRETYGLDDAEGLFRGTLRYPGWCATLKAAFRLGLLDDEARDWPAGATHADVVGRRLPPGPGPLSLRIARFLELETDSPVLARLEWAGLLSQRPLTEPRSAPLDVLVGRLAALAGYRPGERDWVGLENVVTASLPDGSTEETRLTLVAAGEPWGDSAMSRTVSLPAAIATRLLLDGAYADPGVRIPVEPELYRPVLDELASLGVEPAERRAVRSPGPLG